ncbi:hypothetical protein M407DRAFT_22865 [Tulasnella calospora MUT 4182]|uniref:Uncharacterized protein n=1 Tax=Tulasnella calospora MUT 4182 TaxID=1051891 RepID=A0A0C3M2M1_9AGAM|nr:hypothetical protein M407DRAFT_22865 [Tulasnella calospora MUT 4182]
MQSNITLPPIRFLLDEVAQYEAANRFPPTHNPPNPIHTHADHALSSLVSNIPKALVPLPSAPRIPHHFPSSSRPIHSHAPFERFNHPAPPGPSSRCDPYGSMNRWEHYSQTPFLPLSSPSPHFLETASPSTFSYSVPPVLLPGLPKTPSSDLGQTVVAGVGSEPPAQAMDLQPNRVVALPPVPPRHVLEPTPEHDSLFVFRLSAHCPPSPSLSLSPSIEGSPTMANSRLPFALVPATPNQPVSGVPFVEVQAVSPDEPGKQSKSSRVPETPRVNEQLTKNGRVYSRCRPEDLRLPPGRKLVTRKTWLQWEHDAALEALDWYKKWNQDFDLSTSSEDEQRVVLPEIYRYLIKVVEPEDWVRGFDGFLTWAGKAQDRPTTRKPAGCNRPTTRKPAIRGTTRKAAVLKPNFRRRATTAV